MKIVIIPFCFLLILLSCKDEDQGLVLTGNIVGLKKGTVFLQRKIDSSLITLDSVNINGDSNFTFKRELEEPEVLFLQLNKNDNDNGVIKFFATNEPTSISTSLERYIYDVQISGSEQQKILEEYLLMMSRFNDRNLDLIKESFERRRDGDSTQGTYDMTKDFDDLLKRKYLYTINFAINHSDSEVSPYLAVEEISDARTKYLDTIYNSLTPKIKNSKYGKQLQSILEFRNKN